MTQKLLLQSLAILICLGCAEKPNRPPERTFPVSISQAVLQENLPIYLDIIGSVHSSEVVELRPNVTGIIVDFFTEEGANVKKGDPIFLIDPRPYEAALNKAKATLAKDQASLAFAMQRLERYEELVKREYFSKLNYEQYKSDLDEIKAQILIDEAEIALAALDLEWTQLTSPINGKLSMKNVDKGNLVIVNNPTPLITIRQITPIDIFFSISQNVYAEMYETAQSMPLKFEVYLPQMKEKTRVGHVDFIDNQINPSTGTILLKGSIENEDELFWPGEFVRVRLRLKVKPEAIVIPNNAVQMGQDGPFVYVYDPISSQVEYRLVTQGESVKEGVIIEKGLKEAERVVTQGQLNLRPGAKAVVVEHGAK